MATDGPTPPPCNPDIFKNGTGVCVLSGSSNAIENWVKSVAQKANAQVDWHYSGGRANVLHLGDEASRQRVLNAIEELKDNLHGQILSVDGPARYRSGEEIPPGMTAVDPDIGPTTVTLSEDLRTFRRFSPTSKLLSKHSQLWLKRGTTHTFGPIETMSFDHNDHEAAVIMSPVSNEDLFVLMKELRAATKK